MARTTNVLSVTINSGVTLSEMIEAGRYDWKNGDINGENFLVTGEGTVETKLELVHLNKVASTSQVEAYLKKNGLRSATLAELLAFGAEYPETQRKFPVLALGALSVISGGDCCMPYLSGHCSERSIDILRNVHKWGAGCRFLAVRLHG